jgi:UDP-N-acetylmuramoyl-tripeptide--D-alanyl-D-alanine ligase
VCIRGARADGHTFAKSAYDSGAACCLAEQTLPDAAGAYVLVDSTLQAVKKLGKYYRQQFDIPVVGITGSVGKTTTKEMLAATLGAKYRVHKTPENLNNELGVPLTLLSLNKQHEAAVIEMGISEFGEMSRLADMVMPDIMIITKIGYAHIESLGDLKGVLRAKSEVFDLMSRNGTAIVNGDDDLLCSFDPGMKKITFGLGDSNSYRAENISVQGTDAVTCDIVSDTDRHSVNIPAYGNHLVYATLAAAATGRLLGMTCDEITRGILTYTPVGGRANVVNTGYITLIDDCYNANPHSVQTALASLSAMNARTVAILGDMRELGDMSDQLHREIGSAAAQHGVKSLVCCGEKAEHIYNAYTESGGNYARYFPSKDELKAALPELIQKGDAVLVKASNSMRFGEIVAVLERLCLTK